MKHKKLVNIICFPIILSYVIMLVMPLSAIASEKPVYNEQTEQTSLNDCVCFEDILL